MQLLLLLLYKLKISKIRNILEKRIRYYNNIINFNYYFL